MAVIAPVDVSRGLREAGQQFGQAVSAAGQEIARIPTRRRETRIQQSKLDEIERLGKTREGQKKLMDSSITEWEGLLKGQKKEYVDKVVGVFKQSRDTGDWETFQDVNHRMATYWGMKKTADKEGIQFPLPGVIQLTTKGSASKAMELFEEQTKQKKAGDAIEFVNKLQEENPGMSQEKAFGLIPKAMLGEGVADIVKQRFQSQAQITTQKTAGERTKIMRGRETRLAEETKGKNPDFDNTTDTKSGIPFQKKTITSLQKELDKAQEKGIETTINSINNRLNRAKKILDKMRQEKTLTDDEAELLVGQEEIAETGPQTQPAARAQEVLGQRGDKAPGLPGLAGGPPPESIPSQVERDAVEKFRALSTEAKKRARDRAEAALRRGSAEDKTRTQKFLDLIEGVG